MYKVLDVAQYVIERCNSQGRSISNLKLQKILYFVQAQYLVSTGNKCFCEEIEAWDFGPVIPEAYHHYKAYGSANIPTFAKRNSKIISSNDRMVIDEIIDECSKRSASALVQITHNQAPWKNNYVPGQNNTIPAAEIRKYFEEE